MNHHISLSQFGRHVEVPRKCSYHINPRSRGIKPTVNQQPEPDAVPQQAKTTKNILKTSLSASSIVAFLVRSN